MARAAITGDAWISLVLQKLNVDPTCVRRVVIDYRPGQPLMFYIEHIGTLGLLEVRPPEAVECEIVVNAQKGGVE